MTKEKVEQNDWLSAEEKAKRITQAKALRKKAKNGGLRFNAYLPPLLHNHQSYMHPA
ncbi:MAG: hypothetical protein ABL867_10580 [Rickettsiales bacterium]